MASETPSLLTGDNLLVDLKKARGKYDDTGEFTIGDLAAEIELIVNDHKENPLADTLKTAIEAFWEEERYNWELAGRGSTLERSVPHWCFQICLTPAIPPPTPRFLPFPD